MEKKSRVNTKMPYGRFSAINVMTYLEKRYLVQLLQLVVMPHYLTFYNLGYKKKVLCLLISCKNKLFDGSLNSVGVYVVPFSSHKDFFGIKTWLMLTVFLSFIIK